MFWIRNPLWYGFRNPESWNPDPEAGIRNPGRSWILLRGAIIGQSECSIWARAHTWRARWFVGRRISWIAVFVESSHKEGNQVLRTGLLITYAGIHFVVYKLFLNWSMLIQYLIYHSLFFRMYNTVEKNNTSPKKMSRRSVTSLRLYLLRSFLLIWITPDNPLYSSWVSFTIADEAAGNGIREQYDESLNSRRFFYWCRPSPVPTCVSSLRTRRVNWCRPSPVPTRTCVCPACALDASTCGGTRQTHF